VRRCPFRCEVAFLVFLAGVAARGHGVRAKAPEGRVQRCSLRLPVDVGVAPALCVHGPQRAINGMVQARWREIG